VVILMTAMLGAGALFFGAAAAIVIDDMRGSVRRTGLRGEVRR
jgi:hypothetical protein